MTILEVTADEITRLKDWQLHELLNRLLLLEAKNFNIPLPSIHHTCPERITIGDGGQDLRMDWHDANIPHTDFCPRSKVVFQAKATKMTPALCKNEVKKDNGTLKEKVLQVLNDGGAYIIVSSQYRGQDQRDDLINAIILGIKEAGWDDFATKKPVIDFYDVELLKNWVNRYYPLVQWVKKQVNAQSLDAFTFDDWAGNADIFSVEFVADKQNTGLRADLFAQISLEKRKCLRIHGASGIGKSRLLFETFNLPEEEARALSRSVLYTNVQTDGAETAKAIAKALQALKTFAVLVVDDCPVDLHNSLKLSAEHRDAKFQLITIDSGRDGLSEEFEIPPSSEEVIKAIVQQKYAKIEDDKLREIVKLAMGHPIIATTIADALVVNEPYDARFSEGLMNKMLWGRTPPDANGTYLAQTCALFASFGNQTDFADEFQCIHRLTALTDAQFSHFFQHFVGRRTIQPYGRYFAVQPPPIALRLAAAWWKNPSSPEKMRQLFLAKENPTPPRLLEEMCKQMRLLDRIPEARKAVEELCDGPDSPFANAEVLNTAQGSECFRALVEVNPPATMKALTKAFKDFTLDDLLAAKAGRRNLVWALEKLAFRKECFFDAALMLLRFAASENETWANNSTSQFEQLFQLYLPGTEVPLFERFKVIDAGIKLNDPRIDAVLVKALAHGMNIFHFSRGGSADEQGTQKLKDYSPELHSEINDYLGECLNRLLFFLKERPEAQKTVIAELDIQRVRSLITRGLLEKIKDFWSNTKEFHSQLMPAFLSGLNNSLNHDEEEFTEAYGVEYVKAIEEFVEKIWPSDVAGKIELIVLREASDIFRFRKEDDDENFMEAETRNMEELAKEAANAEETLYAYIPKFLSAKSSRTYAFGRYIAEASPSTKKLLEAALEEIPKVANPNLNFVRGLIYPLSKTEPAYIRGLFTSIREKKEYQPHFIDLISSKDLDAADLQDIVYVLKKGGFAEEELRSLTLGGIQKGLPIDAYLGFINELHHFSDAANAIVIDLISMYAYGRFDTELKNFLDILPEILLHKSVFSILFSKKQNSLDKHHYEILFNWLVDNHEQPEVLIKDFLQQMLVAVSKKDMSYPSERVIGNILGHIMDSHSEIAWELIANTIISTSGVERHRLGNLLGDRFNSKKDTDKTLLSGVAHTDIIEWCKKHPETAPEFVVEIFPPLNKEGNDWNPLVRLLIDTFGANKDLLSAIGSNIYSFTWSGRISDYYRMFLIPFQNLLNHPIPSVKKWAQDSIGFLERQIKDGDAEYQERQLGIY